MVLGRLVTCVLLGFLPYAAVGAGSEGGALQLGQHRSPGGACEVRISLSAENGAHELFLVRPKSALVTEDLSGAIWRDANRLVYSVSPIYGRPGLFELDCRTAHSRTIVAAVKKDKAYPDGADYFELVSVNPKKQEACFYYSPDVDSPDLEGFRTQKYIRCVSLK